MSRLRWGCCALALAAVLFVLYPAVRPWHDESTADGLVASVTSGAWVAAHLFAMLGFILVPLGLLALRDAVADTRAERVALASAIVTWIGSGLVLPYYGAEDFGLHATATTVPDGQSVMAVTDEFRFGTVPVTMFGLGLVLLAVGSILAAVAVWRSGLLPRASGLAFALGFVLFLPQFYAAPAIRIAHGVLVGAGCAWLAVVLWRAASASAPK